MNTKIVLLTSLVSFVVTGCGGSSGDSEPLSANVEDLKNGAIGSIGSGFDGSFSALTRTLNANAELGETVNDVATGGSDQMSEDLPVDAEIQNEIQNWMSVSLATDNSENTTTTREGNTITVDPDEEEMCREEGVFDSLDVDDAASCTAFFKDVTVRLIATAEEAGVLTYLYQQKPVLSLGYAPNAESIELDLGGVKAVLEGLAVINPDEQQAEIPNVMTGSFKISSVLDNSTVGQEAGSISYGVVKPIQVENANDQGESSLSIQPSTIFTLSADSAAGNGGMMFNLGAVELKGPIDSDFGQLNLAGMTANADLNPNNGELVVSNFGLSKGPFSVSLNNEEVIKATLGAFGFNVSEGTDMAPGELILDSDLNLSLMAKQFMESDMGQAMMGNETVAAALEVTAPGGTSVSRAGNGLTQIGGTGPVTVTVTETPAEGTPSTDTVQVNSGECFDNLLDDESAAPSADQCL